MTLGVARPAAVAPFWKPGVVAATLVVVKLDSAMVFCWGSAAWKVLSAQENWL